MQRLYEPIIGLIRTVLGEVETAKLRVESRLLFNTTTWQLKLGEDFTELRIKS